MSVKPFLRLEAVLDVTVLVIFLANVARDVTVTLPFGIELSIRGLNAGVSPEGYWVLITGSWVFLLVLVFISLYVWERHRTPSSTPF